MDEKELRELDAWIAEHAFGVEVKRDADGVPYNAAGVMGSQIISWIPHYTKVSGSFDQVKREIERRGWEWGVGLSNSRPPEKRYDFVIYGGDVLLGHVYAETEELAGCRAFKEALSADRQALDKHREIG